MTSATVPLSVLLHAEHITLPRRLLRLPPRSLLPSAGGIDAATFTLRLCGVSVAEEGVMLARKELVKPLVGRYCDAELLYRERRPRGSPNSGGQVIASGSCMEYKHAPSSAALKASSGAVFVPLPLVLS